MLVERAAEVQGLSPAEVLAPGNFMVASEARRAIAYTLDARGWYHSRIGEGLGREHSTVSYAVKKGRMQMRSSPEFAYLVGELFMLRPLSDRRRKYDDSIAEARVLSARLRNMAAELERDIAQLELLRDAS